MVNRLNPKSINHSNNLLIWIIKLQEKKKVINHIEQMNKEYS